MPTLPMLEKNSYLSLVISDNSIWAHLGYTDHNANREYILSDYTDLNPLKQRLDDEFFTKNFWYEYFDNLEKVFNWNIVDREGLSIFTFRKFKEEGDGISGIRVIMDENQKYFNKIFSSLRSFSNDVALRVADDMYIRNLVEGMAEKLGYDDMVYINLDLQDFRIYRSYKDPNTQKREIEKAKIYWNNEYGVIDAIRDGRFRAFLATDMTSKDMLNRWSNFVLNRITFSEDPNLMDILRAYTTAQLHSIYQDNSEKIQSLGTSGTTGIILTGYIPLILGKEKTLISIIDGLEISGTCDMHFDFERRILSFGKSYISGPSSTDLVLTRKEIASVATKIFIPDMKIGGAKSKVIFNGYTDSLEGEKQDIFALYPEFTFKKLPLHRDNLVVEGEFKNGAYVRGIERKEEISFLSVPEKMRYDNLVIDGRPKPIIYGPDVYQNRLKLQQWFR